MKNVVLLLSLAVVVLGAALFLRGKSAKQKLAASQTEVVSLSNQVAEIKTKLTANVAASVGLVESLSNRVAEVASLSNRLVRVTASMEKAQAELAAAQQNLGRCQEQIRSLDAQREALAQRHTETAATLASVQAELATARAEAQRFGEQRAALQAELNQARAEKIELARQLNDLPTLQAQVTRLSEQQRKTRRSASPAEGTPEVSKAKDLKLVLQPDGSVKWVEASAGAPEAR
jgi:chromosome segregation ATPase